jgi:type II secretory pathway component PulM
MKPTGFQAFFERMSDRERKLVAGGAVAVVVALLIVVAVLVSRRVSDMEVLVEEQAQDLDTIVEAAPAFLKQRGENEAVEKQLREAAASSLQSTLLGIAKEIQFERRLGDEATPQPARLSEYIKFANGTEILAELTQKTKGTRKKKQPKDLKEGEQVFLASIDVVFDEVPDTALFQFMGAVESHPGHLFSISLDINRQGNDHEQFRAKMRVGQFRYGRGEEGE